MVVPLTGRAPASFPVTHRIICTTAGVRNKSPVFKHIKTSQGHQIFSGPVVQLAEAYPLMVVLPSARRLEQTKGPVVASWFSPAPHPQCCCWGASRNKWDSLLCFGLQAEVAGLGRSNGKPRPKLLHPKTPSAMRGFPKAECLSIGASPRHNSWCESLPEGRQQPSHGAGMRGPRGIWQALAGPNSGWPQAWCHGSCPWDKTAKNLWSCWTPPVPFRCS